MLYLGTGYYIKVEIACDPGHVLNTSEWALRVLGVSVEPAEL